MILAVFFGIVGHISENTYNLPAWVNNAAQMIDSSHPAGARLHFDVYGVPHILAPDAEHAAQAPPAEGH
ncbi:MAG: hypothetical protein HZB38_06525 [Planctomycetes bacterium]|nr:hypothetical protein [Planctomycetota bacterium]